MNVARQRISICNGRLIDPANGVDDILDLHIEAGRVIAIGSPPDGFKADVRIPASRHIVCPGFIDLAVRLREPGYEHKATIASETAAAVASGITTVCCLPDTQPVIDTPAVVELIRQRAEKSGMCRVLPIGAMTVGLGGKYLSEMAALQDAGCVAVSNAGAPLKSTMLERRALEYAATFGLISILQPIDHDLLGEGCVHEGRISTMLGLPGISEAVETVALARDLVLADYVGARVHIHGLSTAEGAIKFGRSSYQNSKLSADVAMHNLHLTEDSIGKFDSNCHVIPPLRTLNDREELRRAINDGRIGAICSDHQPHDRDAKTQPFPATAPGISGLETLLGLVLRLVEEDVVCLATALERITLGPANVLGLPLGRLDVGSPADVCVFDPNALWQVNEANLLSQGKNTPFHGWMLKGQVNWTIVDGRLVYQRCCDAI